MNETALLVERARSGDRGAYDRLFERAAERVHLYIRLRLGAALRARLEPADVLQETWLQAFGAFDSFQDRGPGSFARWLCRIAENCIRGLADHHGARKRRPEGGVAPLSGVMERLRASTAGPGTRAARHEALSRLASAVEGLDPEAREVVLLRFFQDRTIDEVAAATGRSPTAVRRLLGKAVRVLGRDLGTLAEEPL